MSIALLRNFFTFNSQVKNPEAAKSRYQKYPLLCLERMSEAAKAKSLSDFISTWEPLYMLADFLFINFFSDTT